VVERRGDGEHVARAVTDASRPAPPATMTFGRPVLPPDVGAFQLGGTAGGRGSAERVTVPSGSCAASRSIPVPMGTSSPAGRTSVHPRIVGMIYENPEYTTLPSRVKGPPA
jgi:hypothetical protein